MPAPPRVVLALDGHDAVGKTTLTRALADALGAALVRPYAGTAGEVFLWAAERGDAAFADALARRLVERAAAHAGTDVVVCDRHWMTAFSVLPEPYRAAWRPLPPTTLCWLPLEETLARLRARGEPVGDVEAHARYVDAYADLARREGCPVLRTDRLDEKACLDALLAWARPIVAAGPPRETHPGASEGS